MNIWKLVAIRVAMAVVLAYRPDWDWARHGDVLLFFIAILMGKRMRDFGWSALWAIAAVALLSFVLPLAQVAFWPHVHDPAYPFGAIQPGLGLVVGLTLLLLIVMIGLKRGDTGANKYGPAPFDPQTG